MKGQEPFEGRYQVLEALETDELGVTSLVKDRESGDQLALRTPLPSIVADSALSHELETEFKLAKSLRHPNIGALYEFSWLEDEGGAFIVMEYIQGERLRDFFSNSLMAGVTNLPFTAWHFKFCLLSNMHTRRV